MCTVQPLPNPASPVMCILWHSFRMGTARLTMHTCTTSAISGAFHGRIMVTSLYEGLTEHRQLASAQAPQPRRQLHIPGILSILPEQLLLALEVHLVRILPLHADVRM